MSFDPFHRLVRRLCAVLGAVLVVVAALSSSSTVTAQETAPGSGAGGYRHDSPGGYRFVQEPDGTYVGYLAGPVRVWGDDLEATSIEGRIYETTGEFLLIGDVYVVTDSLKLWSDRLRVRQTSESGVATGNVRLEMDDGTIGTSDRAYYRKRDDWLALVGNARLIDGEFVVSGDSLVYDRAAEFLEAFGSVRVVDQAASTVIVGEHGQLNRATGIARVDSLPRLTSRRRSREEMVVESVTMAFDQAGQWSQAIGNVKFRQGTTNATADTMTFLGEDLLILKGSPRVDREATVLTGDEIRFTYENQKLRQIDVFGDSRLVDASPDTLAQQFSSIPLANVLTGDTLAVYVDAGEIVRTWVRGRASSTYLPDDQSQSISVNEVKGDAIDIRFKDGVVDIVQVDGNVDGSYSFVERRILEQQIAASDSAVVDSLVVPPVVPDSALVSVGGIDSTQVEDLAARADTLTVIAADPLPPAPKLVDFATSAERVTYAGNSTKFRVQKGTIEVKGAAQVGQGTLKLNADRVQVDTNTQEMVAEGNPYLADEGSELVGERMGYLFNHQTGAVRHGVTRFDDGYYSGDLIRRIDQKTLLVKNGTYTSCDLAEPHYHFAAKKMKLKVGESVVARQVTFKLSDIPLMTLPFYYKSLKSGRRSGILFPNLNLGVSSREGRYIRDLGFYWATNEYTDFKFEMDYNERNDAGFTVENNYNVRYGVSGRMRFDYLRRFSESLEGDEWEFEASHRQPELWEVWSGSAAVNLSSSNLTRRIGSTITNDFLPAQLGSDVSISRSFDNGARLSMSASRDQFVNAEDDDRVGTNNTLYRQTAPRFTLSFKSRPLLGALPSGRDGNAFANVLRDIQFSQRYSGSYDRELKEESVEDEASFSGSFGLSYAPRSRVGPFVLTSSASFSEAWRYREFEEDLFVAQDIFNPLGRVEDTVAVPDGTVRELDNEFTPRLSFSNGLRTDLYGIFGTRLGPVRGIKHKLSWNMSHNWSPQLGDKQQSSQNFSFNLTNELSLKVTGQEGAARASSRSASDPTRAGSVEEAPEVPKEEATRKLNQILTWSLSSSYDPDAQPDRRWATINSRVTVRPGVTRAIDLGMSQSIDPYTFDILSSSIDTGLNLQGTADLGGSLRQKKQAKNAIIDRFPTAAADTTKSDDALLDQEESNYELSQRRDAERWLENGTDQNAIPWTFRLTASLRQTKNQISGATNTTATVTTRTGIRLPGEWSLSYNAGFDAERGEFVNQTYELSRKLHHWTLSFSRIVSGDGSDFGFRLYLSDIPDLEVTRGNRDTGDALRRLSNF